LARIVPTGFPRWRSIAGREFRGAAKCDLAAFSDDWTRVKWGAKFLSTDARLMV